MGELHVAVKLYRAACSLSDADWQSFPNQKNSCSCSLFNFCTTAQELIGTNFRISKKKCSRKFKGIWSESSNKDCLCTCLKYSVQPEVWIWNLAKDEAKKILLIWKRRPHVCLSLSSKRCGRTVEVS